MITVDTNFREKAKQKIIDGKKDVKGRKEIVMKDEIGQAICNFIEQDNEFARAIIEGGTFSDCMKNVASGTGDSVSDIDAIRKALPITQILGGCRRHMRSKYVIASVPIHKYRRIMHRRVCMKSPFFHHLPSTFYLVINYFSFY